MIKQVLTIAGTDPTGGAGIQADIKTISATGCYAASVITVLVAQNTQGVQAIESIASDFVTQQLDSIYTDLTISAVKIGMLHNKEIIKVVSDFLKKIKQKNIVLDPVMIAKDGSLLMPEKIISYLTKKLFPLVNLITPNLFEAEKLLKQKINNKLEMAIAAKKLSNLYNINVLIKGGHLNTAQSSDVLYSKEDSKHYWFYSKRINTNNTHGTGCALSSAIASYLAQHYTLKKSIQLAKQYLTYSIKSGVEFKIGKGCGPVNHFYFLSRDKLYDLS